MYSNTQDVLAALPAVRRASERTPSLSTTTISPGSISRIRTQRQWLSSAQLSRGKHHGAIRAICPMHRGRKPCGSRTAISLLGDRMTSEYAPFQLVHRPANGFLNGLSHLRRSRVMSIGNDLGIAWWCGKWSLPISNFSRRFSRVGKAHRCAPAPCAPLMWLTTMGCALSRGFDAHRTVAHMRRLPCGPCRAQFSRLRG